MARLESKEGRIMSVDFGDTRTGLAISDETRFLASGIGYISPGGIEKTADAVAEIARERGAVAIVVGHPINMNGTLGESSERIMKLADSIREQTDIPVVLFDERCTTMAAAQILNLTDTGGQKRKDIIDALSAEIILQNYLDSEKRK